MFNIFCRNRQQRGAERSIEALKVGLAVVDFEAQWDAEQVYRRGVQCAVAGDWQSATIYLYKAAYGSEFSIKHIEFIKKMDDGNEIYGGGALVSSCGGAGEQVCPVLFGDMLPQGSWREA